MSHPGTLYLVTEMQKVLAQEIKARPDLYEPGSGFITVFTDGFTTGWEAHQRLIKQEQSRSAPDSVSDLGEKAPMHPDLYAALAEIMRMRLAAERIMWLAQESPGYGKGRGQAAQEVLDSATERAPRLPVTGRGDVDDDRYVQQLLDELRTRAQASEKAWKRQVQP
jgi:hypothetical protein